MHVFCNKVIILLGYKWFMQSVNMQSIEKVYDDLITLFSIFDVTEFISKELNSDCVQCIDVHCKLGSPCYWWVSKSKKKSAIKF